MTASAFISYVVYFIVLLGTTTFQLALWTAFRASLRWMFLQESEQVL
jgi:hypothetical protein